MNIQLAKTRIKTLRRVKASNTLILCWFTFTLMVVSIGLAAYMKVSSSILSWPSSLPPEESSPREEPPTLPPPPPMESPSHEEDALAQLYFSFIVMSFCLIISMIVLFISLPVYLFSQNESVSQKAGGLVKTSLGFILTSGGGVAAFLGFVK